MSRKREQFIKSYLRLNGYFTFDNFIVLAADDPKRISDGQVGNYTETDVLALRLPHSHEKTGALQIANDPILTNVAAGRPDLLIAEVKSGDANKPNKVWRDGYIPAIEYVVRFFGICADEVEIREVATNLARSFKYERDQFRFRYIVFADSANEHYVKKGVRCITFDHVIDFLVDVRGQRWVQADIGVASLHSQWDNLLIDVFDVANDQSLSSKERKYRIAVMLHAGAAAGMAVEAMELAGHGVVPVRSRARRFYLAITLVLIAIVVRGFWPTYFGPLLGGVVTRHWIIHLHGAIFSGWMVLLLLAQVSLVAMGRVGVHRRVGNVGIAYGALVLGIGPVVSFVAPVLHVRAGEWTLDRAAGFMLLPLVDMVLFAGFFGAAIAYRRRPEIHKRLILAATVALAFAAVARISFESPVVFLLVWLSPLFAAMTFDVFTRGRVHPVYFISVAVLTAAFIRIFFVQSQAWLQIGRALLVPFV